VIFAVRPEIEGVAHFQARFFEADGSEAELCGNGTACFVRWVTANGWADGGEIRILTPAGVVRGRLADAPYVRVCIPDPQDLQTDLELEALGRTWRCDALVTGVPHLVTYVDDVDEVHVDYWGAALRHHARFRPRGVNANFVQVLGEGRLAIRTFEFGVEAETLACGTGSASAALLAARRFRWDGKYLRGEEPILVAARSGDVLRVWITLGQGGAMVDFCLDSVVRFVYEGVLHDETAGRACDLPPAGPGGS